MIYMLVENGTAIRSIPEAVRAAKEAVEDRRVVPIYPCVMVDTTGEPVTCPKLDQTFRTLCKDPDGVTPDPKSGVLQCPQQRGSLVLRNINHS